MYSFRLVNVDYYLNTPVPGLDVMYSKFTGHSVNYVPVIRIFGISPGGVKACIHLHGVFPYLYVHFDSGGNDNAAMYQLSSALEDALNTSLGGTNKKQFIYSMSLENGIPFYGYHEEERKFCKIQFYNPGIIKRAAAILEDGSLGVVYQPHEAHIAYILQFFIDYNLYGMSFINLANFRLREERNDSVHTSDSQGNFRISYCQLEGDAMACEVLNQHNASEGTNPGLAFIWEEERARRRLEGKCSNPMPLNSTPSQREYSPSKSDVRFKNELMAAIKSIQSSARSQDSEDSRAEHVPSDHTMYNVIDDLFDQPEVDQDSILGSQADLLPDHGQTSILGSLDIFENEEDLSQPFIPISPTKHDSDDEIACSQLPASNRSEEENPNTSDVMQVDGSNDSPRKPSTPRKSPRRSPGRYTPLNVAIQKSPKSQCHAETNKIMEQLEKSSSEIRHKALTSPKVKTSVPSTDAGPSAIQDSTEKSSSPNLPPRTLRSKRGRGSSKRTNLRVRLLKRCSSVEDKTLEKKEKAVKHDQPEASTSGVKSARKRLFLSSQEGSSESDHASPAKLLSQKSSSTSSPHNLSVLDTSLNYNEGIVSVYDASQISDSRIRVYTPVLKPPSPEELESTLVLQGMRYTMPSNAFYGDPTYPASSKEVGREMIRLAPKVTSELEEFEGIFSRFGISTISSKGSKRSVIITPVKEPPNPTAIAEWKPSPVENEPCEPLPCSVKLMLVGGSQESQCSLVSTADTTVSKVESSNQRSQRSDTGHIVHSTPVISGFTESPGLTPVAKDSTRRASNLPSIPEEHEDSSEVSKHNTLSGRKKARTTPLGSRTDSYGIDIATPENSGLFKMELQNLQTANMNSMHRHTGLLSMELHVQTRGDLCPNPQIDPITALFYTLVNDVPKESDIPVNQQGILVVHSSAESPRTYTCPTNFNLQVFSSETDLILFFTTFVRKSDPDFLAGFEVELMSWGYLVERGYVLGINLTQELGRLKKIGLDREMEESHREPKIAGRIVLNVWRLMRHEVTLTSYTFENIVYHVLHTRIPRFSYRCLTLWWNHVSPSIREIPINYYLVRVLAIISLLDQLDFIGITSELASLFGIQFYEVLSRGSQFRVESMMLRLSRSRNLVAMSPNIRQRAAMRAPQCLPLIMEPKSRFYTDPVIVLDFQSLYPSMMIAYNYCFSTCLGKVENLKHSEDIEFGCGRLGVPRTTLARLIDSIHVSPAGVAFVPASVRKGVLPAMLEEILSTRLMVKKSMKEYKNDKVLQRVLHARQLGLKLIANVTYGYTSANFSGRMPCVEVGDSVVSKGRETLERAIHLVDNTPRWGCRVVYGDTDSLFVLCPGRTVKQAFQVGQEIANAVKEANPPPVVLKLEKVYFPCILQTKKRYVGYMYENPDDKVPEYDAKGIETVRRDGCPAVAKILEKSIKILFETKDVSKVKTYVEKQMTKLIKGRVNLGELTFAKEYRGEKGYQPTAVVPALRLARQKRVKDPRSEPRVCERVPYVIVAGPPGVPLISLVRDPRDLLADPSLRINSEYYILKAILPPLDRCFSLLGANVFSWYQDLPRPVAKIKHVSKSNAKSTISQFFTKNACSVCETMTLSQICEKCLDHPQKVATLIMAKVQSLERRAFCLDKLCTSCCGRSYQLLCSSLDCPILYRRHLSQLDLQQSQSLRDLYESVL